jgi:phosphoribosylglycinamide formyltransferase 1
VNRVPVGVLISGSGTNLQALLDACALPDHPARVAVVISNRADAGGLGRAERAGVPTAVVGHRDFADRPSFDARVVEILLEHGAQWVAMAGFMRIVTPTLLDAFPSRVLNVHPSLLPAFPGVDAQRQAFEHGVAVAGATVHLVDGGVDTGPILAQGIVPVHPHDTVDTLRARILEIEHRLYPMVLRWAVEGRIRVDGRKAQVDLPVAGRRVLSGE